MFGDYFLRVTTISASKSAISGGRNVKHVVTINRPPEKHAMQGFGMLLVSVEFWLVNKT